MHGWEVTGEREQAGLPSRIPGMDKLLGINGWPKGSIISFIGAPKNGKTTLALQEAILQAEIGHSILYVYNESPQVRFMSIAHRHREELGIPPNRLSTMKFIDMHGLTMRSADYQAIEKFCDGYIISQVERWFMDTDKPTLVVFDSLSKFCRTYTAQAFYFAQHFTQRLWKVMDKYKKYPTVFCINQKSGGHWERDDDSVLGGMGIVHELDGSVVFNRFVVDTWASRDYGFAIGSQVRTIRISDLRDRDVADADHILLKRDGRVTVGQSIADIKEEWQRTHPPEKKGGTEHGSKSQ